jgi:Protein of unknown function (DUF3592)
VEIVFLLAGLAFIAVGVAIIGSEARDRQGTEPVQGRVVGFSVGKSNNPNMASFHSVAEYVGQNGQKYYIEGSIGSSVPLHAVGQAVTVLANPQDPEKAVFKSALSHMLGAACALMGLVSVGIFWLTFSPSLYTAIGALIVLSGLASKIRGAWRKQPLTLEAWHAYKKTLAPRVFTEESKDQIVWADAVRVASAIGVYKKTNRFAIPVLVVVGLGLLFLSYHFYGKTTTFLQKADPAVGIVVEIRERESTDGDSTYSAVVEYKDPAGRDFKFVDSLSSSPPLYHTGQTVNVLYNREDPNEAQIDRGLGNFWVTALLGFGGALFLTLGLHSARKRFRRSADPVIGDHLPVR